MLVVKRPFKSLGKTYTAGAVITEPAVIKRFKGKLAEGKIIEVTEQTYDSISAYFKAKHGVVLPPISKEVNEEKKAEEAETSKADAKKAETPEAKATVKAVVK